MISGHGANIFKYSKDGDLLDFSSNINPYGPTARVKVNILKHVDLIERYPDVSYHNLYDALEKYLHIDQKYINIGNGAMEVIDAVITLFDKIVIFNPSFMEYEMRARVHNKEVLNLDLTDDFLPDLSLLPDNLENSLVIITSPHNPSGRALSLMEFSNIYLNVINRGGSILVDEAFYEFADMDYDLANDFTFYDNLFVVRAATKFFSLPGLRLGYVVSERKEEISKIIPTWSVSSLLENIGEDLFLDEDFIYDSIVKNKSARTYLYNRLNEIEGIHPFKSDANFILIKTDFDNNEIFKKLLERKILIRLCDNYKNLGQEYIRVAVKRKRDNIKLIKAFREIIDDK